MSIILFSEPIDWPYVVLTLALLFASTLAVFEYAEARVRAWWGES